MAIEQPQPLSNEVRGMSSSVGASNLLMRCELHRRCG